jgi:hypothetical protein
MQITMLETRRGSENGQMVRRYEKGQTYEVAEMLGRSFIGSGWAMEKRCADDLIARMDSSHNARSEPGLTAIMQQFDAIFRVPTNPATYADKGEDL